MKSFFRILIAALAVWTAAAPAFAGRIRRGPTSPTRVSKTSASSKKGRAKTTGRATAGPRAMDDGRATQIQSALIRAGYLKGDPTGHSDSASQAAMEKLQADNGWQTKLVPDSRAFIKLGLGPQAPDTPSASTATPSTTATGHNE